MYVCGGLVALGHLNCSTVRLLGISSDMVRIKTSGAVNVSTLTWRSFKSPASFFEPAVFIRVPEEEMRVQ